MTAAEVKKLFDQAEHQRVSGSDSKAVELYLQVVNEPGEYQIPAKHMLGVAYRVNRQPERAIAVLQELLADKNLEPIRRARVLRDYGDALRVDKQYAQASQALEESTKLLEDNEAPAAERAATLGFLARVAFEQKDYDKAYRVGGQAQTLFSQDDNRHMELYHAIFMARLLAVTGRADEAKSLAKELKDAAKQYGKDVHLERLEIIERLADDPEAMEAAIKDSRNPSVS